MNTKGIIAKLTAGALIANLLICPANTSAEKKTFTDVPNWAQQSVNYLMKKKHLMENQMELFHHLKKLTVVQLQN
ncbi:hypothetical protein DJ48_5563 (plasmid) [Bacillus anthracis]|nr:hypothetical protein DJ48_5563 [Bacillus anthracis]UKX86845.1 hypothetical protein KM387_28880 [Bacillus anthracis]